MDWGIMQSSKSLAKAERLTGAGAITVDEMDTATMAVTHGGKSGPQAGAYFLGCVENARAEYAAEVSKPSHAPSKPTHGGRVTPGVEATKKAQEERKREDEEAEAAIRARGLDPKAEGLKALAAMKEDLGL